MNEIFDIVVIGAGPAGSAAAFTAAQEGVSVLLLEEHAEIGVPLACAEGLSRSTIAGYLQIQPDWVAQHLAGSIVRSPQGREFKIEYPNVGWIMNRRKFDPALAAMAESHGAVLKKSARATGIQDNAVIVDEDDGPHTYAFRYVIGADGIASKVGRWLGLDTRLNTGEIEVCAEYLLSNISTNPQYAHLIFGSKYAPGGYAWVFPKSENSANVGLGLSPLKTKKNAKSFLDRWVEEEFPDGQIVKRIFGGVPAKVLKKYSGDNFCLVGDAGRFTDPLSGAGIANGIKSGVIAARNAVKILKGQKSRLESEMKTEILDEIRWHHRVRSVYMKLGDDDFKDIFEIAEKLFGGVTITDINTHQLVKQILFSCPHLLKLGFKLLF